MTDEAPQPFDLETVIKERAEELQVTAKVLRKAVHEEVISTVAREIAQQAFDAGSPQLNAIIRDVTWGRR